MTWAKPGPGRPRKGTPRVRGHGIMRMFRCGSCGEVKHEDQFSKRHDPKSPYSLRKVRRECKACAAAESKARRFSERMGWEPQPRPEPVVQDGLRRCPRCTERKPLDEFYRTSPYCKECQKAYQRARMAARRAG